MTGKAVDRCDGKDNIDLYDNQHTATVDPCEYFLPLAVCCEKKMEYIHSEVWKS